MHDISLIGYGRFGKLLASLLQPEYPVLAFDPANPETESGVTSGSFDEVVECATIFIAVPIRSFKDVIQEIAERVRPGTTVLDVCSVKVYPVTVMQEHLNPEIGIIATHPLFGPDSFHRDQKLNMMIHPVRDRYQQAEHWKTFFAGKGLNILSMTPEEHDRQAANSQGIAHFVGRVLRETGIRSQPVSTVGYEDLLNVVEQTCNDSWELFADLQNFNPYTTAMIDRMETAITSIRHKIFNGE